MTGPRLLLLALIASLAAVVPPAPVRAMASDMSATMSHGRYLGAPDLPLLSAMVAAGGGPRHFDAARLTAMLTAQHHADEIARLDAQFGTRRTARYIATLDSFVDDALGAAKRQHIVLPPPDPALAHDPYELAASLRATGVMPDGRFDVGYFIEHLISRPIHVAVMRQVDDDRTIGVAPNADMHVILTAEMDDLRSLYHLAR
jgi:hypothetical protein